MRAPDAKRTKRVRDASEELSLEEHVALKRRALVDARREAPALRARAAELRAQADGLRARWQARCALDLRDQARELETEADARASMTREHDFEATVVSYLRMYDKGAGEGAGAPAATRQTDAVAAYVRQTDATAQRRAAILDEYLTEVDKAPPKVAMAARDECPRCNVKLLLCAAKSIMTCPTCGYAVAYLDATSTSTAFDETIEYSQYSYKRVNHFLGWLAHVQGKEAHRVPDAILAQVMDHLYAVQRIAHPEDVTQKRVHDALRKMRLRKAYDHVAQIAARLSGNRALRIPPETEEQLRCMFLQMQPAFQRHAPKTRTNFLSYSYVLYSCFRILGLHHMCEGISLLKGREKLAAAHSIFCKMSEDLGWPTFELPPAA
tara:strand:+ start:4931 stop:6067 length:1137 start_codon:yes stop_codon:yes gene_type:complete